jgi:hypothetical protein
MRPHHTGILALFMCVLAAASAPTRARADCCNDFWSCAAAVVTGGLSCAVSAAIDELNAVKKRAEDTKAAAQAERDRLVALMQEETQRRSADAEAESSAKLRNIAADLDAVAEAQRSAFQPRAKQAVKPALAAPAAVQASSVKVVSPGVMQAAPQPAPAPAPAAEADVKAETERALAKLRSLKSDAAGGHAKFVQQEVNTLRRTARVAMGTMRAAFEASLVAPLVGLLGSLPPPDPLLTAAIVAGVAAELDRIEREGNAAIVKKASEADAAIKADADKMAQKLAEQARRETQAERVAELTRNLLGSRSQADLDALRAALGEDPGSAQRMVAMTEAPFVAANLKLPGPTAVGVIRLGPVASVNKLAPVQLTQFEAKAKSELQKQLAAPSASGVEKKKAALIAEAKKRYAKDPTLRDKLIAYIQAGTP